MRLMQPVDITLVSSNVPAGDNQGYMFDAYLNTQTQLAESIVVEIGFNNCDRLALFNLDATSVELELTDENANEVVFSELIDLEVDGRYKKIIIHPVYIYPSATLKVSIHNPGGTAACGKCLIGRSTYIGGAQYGARAGYVDYSIKDINEFGQAYLAPGAWAKKPVIRTIIADSEIDAVFADLAAARATLCVFEGNADDTGYEALQVYGLLENWGIRTGTPMAEVNLQIQGAI